MHFISELSQLRACYLDVQDT